MAPGASPTLELRFEGRTASSIGGVDLWRSCDVASGPITLELLEQAFAEMRQRVEVPPPLSALERQLVERLFVDGPEEQVILMTPPTSGRRRLYEDVDLYRSIMAGP